MKLFKKHPLSQSTVELAVVAVLVLVAMTAMGPYLVRSVNAYMRSWERRADQGQIDINVSSTPGSIPDPTLTCETVDCGDAQHSSQATCIGATADPLQCCIWVKEFAGEESLCAEVPGVGACRTRGMPDASGGGNPGDGCHTSGTPPCCGGLQWFWDNTGMTYDPSNPDLCDNKWACTLPPDPCEYCSGGVCDGNCEDGVEHASCVCPDCDPNSGHYDPAIPPTPEDSPGCVNGDGYCFWQEKYPSSDHCCGYVDLACPGPTCESFTSKAECQNDPWGNGSCDRCVWVTLKKGGTTYMTFCKSVLYAQTCTDPEGCDGCCECIRDDESH